MAEVSAMSDVDAARIGDRLKGITDLLDKLKGFDLSKLGELISAVKAVADADGVKAKVLAGLHVATVYASMTASPDDDALVATVVKIVGKWRNAPLAASTMSADEHAAVHAAAINPILLRYIAQFVLWLIQEFSKPAPA